MATARHIITAAPGADSFSTGIGVQGKFNLSIKGTFVGTVHYQRSFNNGTSWRDVANWTDEIETVVNEPESCQVRIGVKNGNYTSGVIAMRLGQQ